MAGATLIHQNPGIARLLASEFDLQKKLTEIKGLGVASHLAVLILDESETFFKRRCKSCSSRGSMATELRECKKSQHNHNRSYSDAFKATSSSSASCFSFSCSKNRLASKRDQRESNQTLKIQPEPQPSSRGVPWASKIHKSQAKIMKLHYKLSPTWVGTSFVQF